MAKTIKLALQNAAYIGKTPAELLYIIRDAREAYEAIGRFDARAADKYADQVNDAATVLAAIRRGEQPVQA